MFTIEESDEPLVVASQQTYGLHVAPCAVVEAETPEIMLFTRFKQSRKRHIILQ